jgi:hypothetical protein
MWEVYTTGSMDALSELGIERTENKVVATLSGLGLFAALAAVMSTEIPMTLRLGITLGICLVWGLLMYVGLNYAERGDSEQTD